MCCPFCKKSESRVVDSRSPGDGFVIRRRRECLACRKRFTTYERIEQEPLRVVKKDGSRVPFDRSKILAGIRRACEKRPVSEEAIDQMVTGIEMEAHEQPGSEVPSAWIGERVMERLRKADPVAYIRFASVYRAFKDVTDFVEEARPMLEGGAASPRRREGGASGPARSA